MKVGGLSLILPKDAMKLLWANELFKLYFLASRTFKFSWGIALRSCNLLTTVRRVPLPCGCSPQISLPRVGPKFGTTLLNHGRWWWVQLHTFLHQSHKILYNSIFGGGRNTKVFTLAIPWIGLLSCIGKDWGSSGIFQTLWNMNSWTRRLPKLNSPLRRFNMTFGLNY